MRLDRLVKQTKTSAPDIRLAHPPCTTDSECMVNNHFPTITMGTFNIISLLQKLF